MELHKKISPEGLRIGYLYDNANEEDKKSIDEILKKYSDLFPLIYSGLSFKMVTDIEEAQRINTLSVDKREK